MSEQNVAVAERRDEGSRRSLALSFAIGGSIALLIFLAWLCWAAFTAV
jgi:hypothetical protein